MGKLIVYATIAALLAAAPAQSQQPPAAQAGGIKRTVLQRVDIPGTSYETVLGVAEIAAGINAGRHTHPGPETGTASSGNERKTTRPDPLPPGFGAANPTIPPDPSLRPGPDIGSKICRPLKSVRAASFGHTPA